MTDLREEPEGTEAPPTARVQRRRWGFPVVWVVPVLAAIVAGYLVYGSVRELGPTITIKFKDGEGVKAGQTEVRYRGVPIGGVTKIELSDNGQDVAVTARLRRSASTVAREGSAFWIVRPEVGFGSITGLSTVITGPYIQVLPGTGEARSEFTGLESAPPALESQGLRTVLVTTHVGSVRLGSPVHYRGIEVGSVTGTDLSRDATTVHIHVFIRQRYERLVRTGSKFWAVSGLDVNLSLLRGLEINVESLRSLATGGIAFATPNTPGPPAKDGTMFVLHDKPQKEWLDWLPKIPIPAG